MQRQQFPPEIFVVFVFPSKWNPPSNNFHEVRFGHLRQWWPKTTRLDWVLSQIGKQQPVVPRLCQLCPIYKQTEVASTAQGSNEVLFVSIPEAKWDFLLAHRIHCNQHIGNCEAWGLPTYKTWAEDEQLSFKLYESLPNNQRVPVIRQSEPCKFDFYHKQCDPLRIQFVLNIANTSSDSAEIRLEALQKILKPTWDDGPYVMPSGEKQIFALADPVKNYSWQVPLSMGTHATSWMHVLKPGEVYELYLDVCLTGRELESLYIGIGFLVTNLTQNFGVPRTITIRIDNDHQNLSRQATDGCAELYNAFLHFNHSHASLDEYRSQVGRLHYAASNMLYTGNSSKPEANKNIQYKLQPIVNLRPRISPPDEVRDFYILSQNEPATALIDHPILQLILQDPTPANLLPKNLLQAQLDYLHATLDNNWTIPIEMIVMQPNELWLNEEEAKKYDLKAGKRAIVVKAEDMYNEILTREPNTKVRQAFGIVVMSGPTNLDKGVRINVSPQFTYDRQVKPKARQPITVCLRPTQSTIMFQHMFSILDSRYPFRLSENAASRTPNDRPVVDSVITKRLLGYPLFEGEAPPRNGAEVFGKLSRLTSVNPPTSASMEKRARIAIQEYRFALVSDDPTESFSLQLINPLLDGNTEEEKLFILNTINGKHYSTGDTLACGVAGGGKSVFGREITMQMCLLKKAGEKVLDEPGAQPELLQAVQELIQAPVPLISETNTTLNNTHRKLLSVYKEVFDARILNPGRILKLRSLSSVDKEKRQSISDEEDLDPEVFYFPACHILRNPVDVSKVNCKVHRFGSCDCPEISRMCDVFVCTVDFALYHLYHGGLFQSIKFPIYVLDEVAQIAKPKEMCLRTLLYKSHAVLCGDTAQLAAKVGANANSAFWLSTVRSSELGEEQWLPCLSHLESSMENKMKYPGDISTIMLCLKNYRSPAPIPEILAEFYQLEIIGAAPKPTNDLLQKLIKDFPTLASSAVAIIPVQETGETNGQGYESQEEANMVAEIMYLFRKAGVSLKSFQIVCPYAKQLSLVSNTLKHHFPGIQFEMSTLDSCQGTEVTYLVISLARNMSPSGSIGFIADHRRCLVALTRFRIRLIIIGDPDVIRQMPLIGSEKLWSTKNIMTSKELWHLRNLDHQPREVAGPSRKAPLLIRDQLAKSWKATHR